MTVAVIGLLFPVILAGCQRNDTPRSPEDASAKTGVSRDARPPRTQKDTHSQADPRRQQDDPSTDQLLQRAQRLAEQGERQAAQEVVRQLLIRDPQSVPALFLAGNLEAAAGNWNEAIAMLDEIPHDHPEASLPALGQSADWLVKAERWNEAERRYRKILRRQPEAGMVHRRLAQLLNRQGRREEAAEHVRWLCRRGDVSEPELHSLISIPDAYLPGQAAQSGGSGEPAGALGKARLAFSEARFSDAAALLAAAAEQRPLSGPEAAFHGRVLAEQQRLTKMPAWLESCPPEASQFGDYWAALGTWMLLEEDHEKAVDFFCEAVHRVPTDRISFNRLSRSLNQLGQDAASQCARRRGDLLAQTYDLGTEIGSTERPDPEMVEHLADSLERLHRPVEAVMWRAVAASYRGDAGEVMPQLNQRRLALLQQPREAPPDWLLCGLQRDPQAAESAIAQLGGTSRRPAAAEGDSRQSQPARFVNVGPEVGVDGRFYNTIEQTDRLTLLHRSVGGGVAVLDFDRDGRCDLYFPQGASVPEKWQGQRPNQMYRNLGDRFQWVTEQAGTDDRRFGQGVTAGDFNADGFPDLWIANIGPNRLLLNQGDGTFRDATALVQRDSDSWTTCVAIADIDGDHLPDLVESNYIDDPHVFVEPPTVDPETGEPVSAPLPGPLQFRAASDWLHRNRGDGTTQSSELKVAQGQEIGDALGLLVTDIDGRGKNEIFVANDMRANHYWVRKSDTVTFDMLETAVTAGCAYSARGNANACMGVAAGDFTGDGLIDMAVTNFADEPMNFYVQSSPGRFIDSAARYDLFEPSFGLTSFGTQALDYDNNGRLDLAIISGHIHDDPSGNVPFRMPPQLFDGTGSRFKLTPVEDPSGYWQTASLGRALAKLDWNRDGRIDLVATHLDLPHALLENRTESPGHWLQLRLVGTTSERDAIGARVRLVTENDQWTETVNTGDGFECKNEPVVAFGLGQSDAVETLKVTWPSGKIQVFHKIQVDRRLLIVENEDKPFKLHTPD